MSTPILEVKGLKTVFHTEAGTVHAVDGLDFTLHENETLASVGESGCGKSVASLSILRLIATPPGEIVSGQILYKGQDLLKLTKKEMVALRGNEISMIFQEPMTSLNPVFTIGYQLMDPFIFHRKCKKEEAAKLALEMLKKVGIPSPENVMHYYPHQLSGGMRQRVMIAMALACEPSILIADEPTTALDVTIQAQILELIANLKDKENTSVILITHDLGIVAQIAQNIMVMYAGQCIEYAPTKALFENPLHPYTRGLLKSIPNVSQKVDMLYSIKGTVPDSISYPPGCRFCDRCEENAPACRECEQALLEVEAGHWVRCCKVQKENKA